MKHNTTATASIITYIYIYEIRPQINTNLITDMAETIAPYALYSVRSFTANVEFRFTRVDFIYIFFVLSHKRQRFTVHASIHVC